MPIFNSFKEGSTLEIFPSWCLYRSDNELFGASELKEHRQHVTSYFRKGFKKGSIDTLEELQEARKEYAKRK